MGLLAYLISMALFGLFIGALGRLSLPGPDPMGLLATMAVGIVATLMASVVVYAVNGGRSSAVAIPVAAGFATLIIYLIRRSRGGGLEDPGIGPRTRRRR